MTRLTLTRPDDWHLHLRDGTLLVAVLPDTARRFARAMVMPNLDPPVRTVGEAFLAGATTNSAFGVTDLSRCDEVFAATEEVGLPLLLHGEVTDADVDVFDREAVFIERHLIPIVERFPGLKVVLEHITTREAVEFVAAAPLTGARGRSFRPRRRGRPPRRPAR